MNDRVPHAERFKVGQLARVVNRKYTLCGLKAVVVRVNYRPKWNPVVYLRDPRNNGDECAFYHADLAPAE